MRKLKIIIALLMLCALFYYYKSRPNFQDWVAQTDLPIIDALDNGARHYQQGDYPKALASYQQAEQLANVANDEANRQWLAMQSPSDDDAKKIERLRPKPQYLLGRDNSLYRGGVNYFKNRIGEANYCLALTMFQELKFKYRLDEGNNFAPPEDVLKPIFTAIDNGIMACPQSTSLRLVKAEILAACQAYSLAITVLEETLIIDPQSAEAYNQLGLIYSSRFYLQSETAWKEYHEKAIAMFKKSTQCTTLDGTRLPAPFYSLGMYYATPVSAEKNAKILPADAKLAQEYLKQFIEITNDKNSALVKNAEIALQKLK